jgi:hypothetical protein
VQTSGTSEPRSLCYSKLHVRVRRLHLGSEGVRAQIHTTSSGMACGTCRCCRAAGWQGGGNRPVNSRAVRPFKRIPKQESRAFADPIDIWSRLEGSQGCRSIRRAWAQQGNRQVPAAGGNRKLCATAFRPALEKKAGAPVRSASPRDGRYRCSCTCHRRLHLSLPRSPTANATLAEGRLVRRGDRRRSSCRAVLHGCIPVRRASPLSFQPAIIVRTLSHAVRLPAMACCHPI